MRLLYLLPIFFLTINMAVMGDAVSPNSVECVSPPELATVVELSQDQKAGRATLVIKTAELTSGTVEHVLLSNGKKIASSSSVLKKNNEIFQVFEFSIDQKSTDDIWMRSRVIQPNGTATMSVDKRIFESQNKALPKADAEPLVPVLISQPNGTYLIEHLSPEKAEQLRGKEAIAAIGKEEIDTLIAEKAKEVSEEKEATE